MTVLETYDPYHIKDEWVGIADTYNEDDGVKRLYATQEGDQWVYAQIEWRFGVPTLEWVVKDGLFINLEWDS